MIYDPSPIFIILFVLGMLAIFRKRGMGIQHRLERQIAELRAERRTPPSLQPGPTADQVQMLEDRVRVLERIVTDQNYDLAREIEALRDRKADHRREVQ